MVYYYDFLWTEYSFPWGKIYSDAKFDIESYDSILKKSISDYWLAVSHTKFGCHETISLIMEDVLYHDTTERYLRKGSVELRFIEER